MSEVKKICNGCHLNKELELFMTNNKEYKTCQKCREKRKKAENKVVILPLITENQEDKIECSGCKMKKTIEHFMNDKGKQYKTCNTCRSYDNKFKNKEYSSNKKITENKDKIESSNKQCKKCHKYLELTKFTEESAANCNECKEKDKAYKKEKRAKAKKVEETD